MSFSLFQLIILILRFAGWAALIIVIVLAARQANRLNKNPLLWGATAATVFAGLSMLVKKVSLYLFDGVSQSVPILIASVFSYHVLSLLAGLLGCFILRREYFARQQHRPSPGEHQTEE